MYIYASLRGSPDAGLRTKAHSHGFNYRDGDIIPQVDQELIVYLPALLLHGDDIWV